MKKELKINLERIDLYDKNEKDNFDCFKIEGKLESKVNEEELKQILESKDVKIVYEVE